MEQYEANFYDEAKREMILIAVELSETLSRKREVIKKLLKDRNRHLETIRVLDKQVETIEQKINHLMSEIGVQNPSPDRAELILYYYVGLGMGVRYALAAENPLKCLIKLARFDPERAEETYFMMQALYEIVENLVKSYYEIGMVMRTIQPGDGHVEGQVGDEVTITVEDTLAQMRMHADPPYGYPQSSSDKAVWAMGPELALAINQNLRMV